MSDDRRARLATEVSHRPGSSAGMPARAPLDTQQVSVGRRLRDLRARAGLSLRSLAGESGLSVNTLSLIENERTSPGVSTLQRLSHALRVPLTEFVRADQPPARLIHQRAGRRPRAPLQVGVMEDLGSGMPLPGMEPLILTLNPAAQSGRTPIVHTGREFVYCLEGRVLYTVEEREYRLDPGDSLWFEASLPHVWGNPDTHPARMLLVLSPGPAPADLKQRHFLR